MSNIVPPTPSTHPRDFGLADIHEAYVKSAQELHDRITLLEYRSGMRTEKSVVEHFAHRKFSNFEIARLIEKWRVK